MTSEIFRIPFLLGSKDGTVVRALASHQCGPGCLIPSMCIEFVVGSRPFSEGFSLGFMVFLSPQKTNTFKF